MRLLETEKESKIVKQTVEVALIKLNPPYSFSQKNSFAFASNDINLAIEVNDFCKVNDIKIFFPEPDSPDIIAIPFFTMIVDRNYIGKSAWEDYCEYCRESEENSPIIIIDSIKKYPIQPTHDNVFLIEQWNRRAILEKLKDLVVEQ